MCFVFTLYAIQTGKMSDKSADIGRPWHARNALPHNVLGFFMDYVTGGNETKKLHSGISCKESQNHA